MSKTRDPKNVFAEGWEPSSAQPIGPGGAVAPTPKLLPVIEPPTLCAQGPCRHYHELVTLANYQGPRDGSLVEYRSVIKTCYPHPGIEMPLNDVPVFECSRWHPEPERTNQDYDCDAHQKTAQWAHYERELAAWNAAVAEAKTPPPDPVPETSPASAGDLAALGLSTPTNGEV